MLRPPYRRRRIARQEWPSLRRGFLIFSATAFFYFFSLRESDACAIFSATQSTCSALVRSAMQ
jgi:hypothetical protein